MEAPVILAISSHTLYPCTDRLSKGGPSWLLGDFLAAFLNFSEVQKNYASLIHFQNFLID